MYSSFEDYAAHFARLYRALRKGKFMQMVRNELGWEYVGGDSVISYFAYTLPDNPKYRLVMKSVNTGNTNLFISYNTNQKNKSPRRVKRSFVIEKGLEENGMRVMDEMLQRVAHLQQTI